MRKHEFRRKMMKESRSPVYYLTASKYDEYGKFIEELPVDAVDYNDEEEAMNEADNLCAEYAVDGIVAAVFVHTLSEENPYGDGDLVYSVANSLEILADNYMDEYFEDKEDMDESRHRRGRMIRESRRSNGHVLKEANRNHTDFIPYTMRQYYNEYDKKWHPCVVYINSRDNGEWWIECFDEWGTNELGWDYEKFTKNGTSKCDPEEVKRIEDTFISDCKEYASVPLRKVSRLRNFGSGNNYIGKM